TTTTTTTPSGLTTTTPGVGVTSTFPGGGGGSTTAPIGTTSASPSESAPSTPGGGGDTFKDCMGFWDAGTHMSNREGAGGGRRVMNRLESLKSELTTASTTKSEPSATDVMKSELGTTASGAPANVAKVRPRRGRPQAK